MKDTTNSTPTASTYTPADQVEPRINPEYVESIRKELEEMRARKDDAYLERNCVVALVGALAVRMGWPVSVTKTAIEGWHPAWHNCIYIVLPTGQLSWHFHDDHAPLFAGFPTAPIAWDGHSTAVKYGRIEALVRYIFEVQHVGFPENLSFGSAIEHLRAGRRVTRAGWNGKGMYLWMLPEAKVPAEWCKEPHLKELAESNPDGSNTMHCLPSIRMKTAGGAVLTGWLASQTDIFATDWLVVG